MRSSIKICFKFLLYFEVTLYFAFRLIQTFIPSTLIFDQILFISILNTSIFIVFLWRKKQVSSDMFIAIISLGLSFMLINQTFILNVDRSRSTFVLSWVDKGFVSKDKSGKFITEGISSSESINSLATEQRLRENIDRGLITVEGSKVRLTMSGSLLLRVCETTAHLFSLQGWKKNSN